MTPRRHVDALFTAAHDDDLSPIDEARFHAHIRSCKDCAAAFAEFVATVEALHDAPQGAHGPGRAPALDAAGRGTLCSSLDQPRLAQRGAAAPFPQPPPSREPRPWC